MFQESGLIYILVNYVIMMYNRCNIYSKFYLDRTLMKKITIQEIANRAGVSTATVSRVLNKKGQISPETETKVLNIVNDLKVRSGSRSISLKHLRIGMMVTGVDNPSPEYSFFNEVITGASSEAHKMGYAFLMAPLYQTGNVDTPMLRHDMVDGLIIAGAPIEPSVVESLNRLAIPSVFIGRNLNQDKPINYVTPDNYSGGWLAANHLRQCGHKKIVVINGPSNLSVFHERLRGVLDVYSQSNELQVISLENFDEAAGYEAVRNILKSGYPFTAILALSDWMAIGALRGLNEHGLSVPEDISLVGFSDLPIARLLKPPLTTIQIPQQRLGSLGVYVLSSLIHGDITSPVGMVVSVELVVRQSTAAPVKGAL